jgi:CheY-like chemotaxis protein
LSVVRQINEYEIRISDDGRGIDTGKLRLKGLELGLGGESSELSDAEALELIFREGLSTAEKVGMNAGRGVGMRIVRECVRSKGGSISVESVLGQGTLMIIRLPANETRQPDRYPCQTKPSNRGIVLVVDDSASVRFASSSILKSSGWDVITCTDGTEARTLLEGMNDLPQVIVSDIEMPILNGFDLLRSLRSDERFSSVPVVMCSSQSDDASVTAAQQLGACAFVLKPFTETELLSAIERALR